MTRGFNKTFWLLALTMSFFISSCKKKEIAGPQGDPGTPGAGGNVSVTTTSILVITSSQWSPDLQANCMRATIDFPQITNAVISRGAIKVFVQNGTSLGGPVWAELPFVTGDLITQYGFDEGHLYLNFVNIEGGMPSAPPTNNYRVVILSEIK